MMIAQLALLNLNGLGNQGPGFIYVSPELVKSAQIINCSSIYMVLFTEFITVNFNGLI
jgi:hypothetical protein